MIPHLFYYQLAVLGLLWLWVMLHAAWPSRCATAQGTPVKPILPRRQRSKEPKPFAGLTHRSHCALCEYETTHPPPPPPVRPAPMPSTHRRPRVIATSMHFCPHDGCAYRGWLGLGNLRANGHPSGGPWRQFHCTACKGYFLETHGTLLPGKRVSLELRVHVLACLAEGLGIRATARVFEVDLNTVLGWLVEAAEHLQALARSFLCDVHIRQLQLDELYAVLRAVKDDELGEAEAIQRLERSPHWVWTAMDPESKLLLAIDVGERTLVMAQRLVHHVVQVLAPGWVPLFLTDGFKDSLTALLTHYGQWVQLPRRQDKGPAPKPRWMPLPHLLYAHVVKTMRRRRLVKVRHRGVFGTLDAVEHGLLACGRKITTAFVERLNLTIRQPVPAVGRRVHTRCQAQDGLRQPLVLFHTSYTFCLPHASLRQPLPQPEPTNGTGSARVWRPCTPAMAAGLTDHVWSLQEVLLCRVPPWPQTQRV
jgi:IS1 family transposase